MIPSDRGSNTTTETAVGLASAEDILDTDALILEINGLRNAKKPIEMANKCYIIRRLVMPKAAVANEIRLIKSISGSGRPDTGNKNPEDKFLKAHTAAPEAPLSTGTNTDNNGLKLGLESLYEPTELFEIRRSSLGGLGVFASKKLETGEVIHTEKPLLKSRRADLHADFACLSEAAKQKFLQLARSPMFERYPVVEQIRRANAFEVSDQTVAIFWVASRFNHACAPVRNVRYSVETDGTIRMWTCKEISAGDELLISYGIGTPSLYRIFGFRCTCTGCPQLTDRDIDYMDNYNWRPVHYWKDNNSRGAVTRQGETSQSRGQFQW